MPLKKGGGWDQRKEILLWEQKKEDADRQALFHWGGKRGLGGGKNGNQTHQTHLKLHGVSPSAINQQGKFPIKGGEGDATQQ